MVTFEGCARRMGQIEPFLEKNGLKDLDEARSLGLSKGIDVEQIVKGVQAIAFENADGPIPLAQLFFKSRSQNSCRARKR